MTSTYAELVNSGRPVLTDGATGTRLRLETALVLDPVLDVAGLAVGPNASVLRAVAGEYVAIASELGLPIELDSMSYWASPDHLAASGRLSELVALNVACVDALAPLKQRGQVYVAGVVGPRADGYRPVGAMDVAEAAEYHSPQAHALADAGADLLLGSTMSTLGEAVGVAQAMASTRTPYVIAPVIRSDGSLPDGTCLADLVATIDRSVTRAPIHYLISCTHPSTALAGMRHLRDSGRDVRGRVIGIKANGSAMEPEQLDTAAEVIADAPLRWLADLKALRAEFDFRVMGGCCGTDGRHILALGLEMC